MKYLYNKYDKFFNLEYIHVLNDLVNHALLKNRNYKIVHYDSRDIRGVDVALLYNPKFFTAETSRKLFVAGL